MAHHQTVQRCVERAAGCGALAGVGRQSTSRQKAGHRRRSQGMVGCSACRQVKDLGYPHELWTTRFLARHAREHGPLAGHACLADLVQGTVCKIIDAHAVKPHKIRYYLERRDPEFEEKVSSRKQPKAFLRGAGSRPVSTEPARRARTRFPMLPSSRPALALTVPSASRLMPSLGFLLAPSLSQSAAANCHLSRIRLSERSLRGSHGITSCDDPRASLKLWRALVDRSQGASLAPSLESLLHFRRRRDHYRVDRHTRAAPLAPLADQR